MHCLMTKRSFYQGQIPDCFLNEFFMASFGPVASWVFLGAKTLKNLVLAKVLQGLYS